MERANQLYRMAYGWNPITNDRDRGLVERIREYEKALAGPPRTHTKVTDAVADTGGKAAGNESGGYYIPPRRS